MRQEELMGLEGSRVEEGGNVEIMVEGREVWREWKGEHCEQKGWWGQQQHRELCRKAASQCMQCIVLRRAAFAICFPSFRVACLSSLFAFFKARASLLRFFFPRGSSIFTYSG